MTYRDLLPYGFSEAEAKVYMAALELGESSVERIAKKAGLPRTSIYHTIDLLKERDLLAAAKRRGKQVYLAEDPRKIREQAEQQLQSLNNLVPQLRSIANAIDKKPAICYFEGKQEIKNLYRRLLEKPNSEVQFWFSDEEQTGEYVQFWDKEFAPQRVERRIRARAIGQNSQRTKVQQSKDSKQLRTTRIDSHPSYHVSAEILLAENNRTLIVSHQKMIGLLIEDKNIRDSLHAIFERHWSILG